MKCDILCIQEHWLQAYEGKHLNDYFPCHKFAIRCIDDNSIVLPNVKSGATSGVAIIWSDEMDKYVEPVDGGSHRTIALKIQTANNPVLLLNSYMPCTGSTQGDYNETLDEVFHMISKHSECSLIWTGDMNADATRMPPSSNDLKFKKICMENELQISPKMLHEPTFHHFYPKDCTSCIDLVVERRNYPVITTSM